jgi:FkbH-like protein
MTTMSEPTTAPSLAPRTPAEFHTAARSIANGDVPGLDTVNVAILATFTAELLEPYLVVEGARRGLKIRPHFLPFNQLELQAMSAESALYASQPAVIIVGWRLEELSADLAHRFLRLDPDAIEAELSTIEDRARSLLDSIRRHSTATILVFNVAPPRHASAGLADPTLVPSQASVVQRLNDRLAAVVRETSGSYIVDYARAVLNEGLREWTDLRLLYRGRIPFGARGQRETGRLLARTIRAALKPPAKCLVLDLDNTLWGGVLGEDGAAGIHLGEDHPGSPFKDFQRAVVSLRDRGILLAISSKNDERDALALIESHPDCLLRAEHFSAKRINWEDKATSLRAIAAELSIGLDALAFFDDSPVEREWVRSQLPQVQVIDVPASPVEYVDALFDSGAFDQLTVSREDAARAALYDQERSRKSLESRHADVESFLRDLGLSAQIGRVDAETLPRVAQLLSKTNQFNLTTRRHSAADIERMAASGVALWMRVRDRFGDAGLVGVAIAIPLSDTQWELDTFLLSCRVIGRNVETALLATLCDAVRAKGGTLVRGMFVPTDRNAPARDFLPRHGFVPSDAPNDALVLSLAGNGPRVPDYIAIEN